MKKYVVVLLLIVCSCADDSSKHDISFDDSLRSRENELLKRELALKEKELEASNRELLNTVENDLPISELYKQVKSGVFMVYTQGSDNISQGTGFFLNSTGIAISNFHVFENAQDAIVVLDNGENCLISKIIDANRELDYVIFQVEGQQYSFNPLQISSELTEIGDACFAIGNPKGLTQTLSNGIVSGYRAENNWIQTTTEITHGSSGGPLFNKHGQVIGITSSGFEEANLNFALNISKVPYQNYVFQKENTILKSNEIPTALLISTIKTYYSTVFNDDYGALYNLYTPILDRFFKSFSIDRSVAIEKAKNYKSESKILKPSNNIHWETMKVNKSSDGSFHISFNMDYYISRDDQSKPKSFNLNIFMTVTDQMKIRSIYESILHKQ